VAKLKAVWMGAHAGSRKLGGSRDPKALMDR
jgi:hypothetical protein